MIRARAVVFDLDGTLVDSAPAIRDVAGQFLAELGADALTLDETHGFIGRGAAAFVDQALAARGLAPGAAERARLQARFETLYAQAPGAANRPYPGVEAALQALGDAGIPLGLCTNKPEAPTRAVLAALGWSARFAALVAGDSLARRKPDPAPLLHALEQLAVPVEDALYVGDSETDAETARAAGCRFVLWPYGYRKALPEAMGALLVLERFEDLTEAVLPQRGLAR
ncbi:MAG: phosphoglycolate phosphatase [Pseudomonadota bacterium]